MKQAAKLRKAGTSIVTRWDRNTEGIGGSHPVTSTGAKGRGGDMGTIWGPVLGTHRCVGGVERERGSGEGQKPTGTFRLRPEGEGGSDGGQGEWGKGFVPDRDMNPLNLVPSPGMARNLSVVLGPPWTSTI